MQYCLNTEGLIEDLRWSLDHTHVSEWVNNNARSIQKWDMQAHHMQDVGWAWMLYMFKMRLSDYHRRPGWEFWEMKALETALHYKLYDTSQMLKGTTLEHECKMHVLLPSGTLQAVSSNGWAFDCRHMQRSSYHHGGGSATNPCFRMSSSETP